MTRQDLSTGPNSISQSESLNIPWSDEPDSGDHLACYTPSQPIDLNKSLNRSSTETKSKKNGAEFAGSILLEDDKCHPKKLIGDPSISSTTLTTVSTDSANLSNSKLQKSNNNIQFFPQFGNFDSSNFLCNLFQENPANLGSTKLNTLLNTWVEQWIFSNHSLRNPLFNHSTIDKTSNSTDRISNHQSNSLTDISETIDQQLTQSDWQSNWLSDKTTALQFQLIADCASSACQEDFFCVRALPESGSEFFLETYLIEKLKTLTNYHSDSFSNQPNRIWIITPNQASFKKIQRALCQSPILSYFLDFQNIEEHQSKPTHKTSQKSENISAPVTKGISNGTGIVIQKQDHQQKNGNQSITYADTKSNSALGSSQNLSEKLSASFNDFLMQHYTLIKERLTDLDSIHNELTYLNKNASELRSIESLSQEYQKKNDQIPVQIANESLPEKIESGTMGWLKELQKSYQDHDRQSKENRIQLEKLVEEAKAIQDDLKKNQNQKREQLKVLRTFKPFHFWKLGFWHWVLAGFTPTGKNELAKLQKNRDQLIKTEHQLKQKIDRLERDRQKIDQDHKDLLLMLSNAEIQRRANELQLQFQSNIEQINDFQGRKELFCTRLTQTILNHPLDNINPDTLLDHSPEIFRQIKNEQNEWNRCKDRVQSWISFCHYQTQLFEQPLDNLKKIVIAHQNLLTESENKIGKSLHVDALNEKDIVILLDAHQITIESLQPLICNRLPNLVLGEYLNNESSFKESWHDSESETYYPSLSEKLKTAILPKNASLQNQSNAHPLKSQQPASDSSAKHTDPSKNNEPSKQNTDKVNRYSLPKNLSAQQNRSGTSTKKCDTNIVEPQAGAIKLDKFEPGSDNSSGKNLAKKRHDQLKKEITTCIDCNRMTIHNNALSHFWQLFHRQNWERTSEGIVYWLNRELALSQRKLIQSEPVIDCCEIKLQIYSPVDPTEEAQLCALVFPHSYSISTCHEYLWKELGILSVLLRNPDWQTFSFWSQQEDYFHVRMDNLIVHDVLDLGNGILQQFHDFYTVGFLFSNLSWDLEQAKNWWHTNSFHFQNSVQKSDQKSKATESKSLQLDLSVNLSAKWAAWFNYYFSIPYVIPEELPIQSSHNLDHSAFNANLEDTEPCSNSNPEKDHTNLFPNRSKQNFSAYWYPVPTITDVHLFKSNDSDSILEKNDPFITKDKPKSKPVGAGFEVWLSNVKERERLHEVWQKLQLEYGFINLTELVTIFYLAKRWLEDHPALTIGISALEPAQIKAIQLILEDPGLLLLVNIDDLPDSLPDFLAQWKNRSVEENKSLLSRIKLFDSPANCDFQNVLIDCPSLIISITRSHRFRAVPFGRHYDDLFRMLLAFACRKPSLDLTSTTSSVTTSKDAESSAASLQELIIVGDTGTIYRRSRWYGNCDLRKGFEAEFEKNWTSQFIATIGNLETPVEMIPLTLPEFACLPTELPINNHPSE